MIKVSMRLVIAILLACLLTANAVKQYPFSKEQKRGYGKDYFPLQYEMKYNFSLPYWKGLQQDGLTYPVHMWVDEELDASRMDVYNGIDTTINVGGLSIILTPRIDKEICIEAEDGPQITSSLRQSGALPNLNKWSYEGQTNLKGKLVDVYSTVEHEGVRKARYTFYVTGDGQPVRFYMVGQDFFSGSHFDEYIADFEYFKTGPVDASLFKIPDICKDVTRTYSYRDFEGAQFQFAKFLPFPYQGDQDYDEFKKNSDRQIKSHGEYHHRRHLYAQNKKYVNQYNQEQKLKKGQQHELELNQYADWSQQEFKATKFGRIPHLKNNLQLSKRNNNSNDHFIPYAPLVDYKTLPKNFSWVGTPNDGKVKDQGVCGSCWSFGATGAMEAAWYNFTGKFVSLSEQQLADCSWDYENNACNGGLSEQAINYVVDKGGLSSEDTYEYEGNDDYCRFDWIKPAAVFKGYTVVPNNVNAIKEAIYSRGPMQIAIDAALNSFRFYRRGIYYDKKCKMGAMDLDHSIILVGYGTSADGEDYWIVKNTWSTHWGDGGYMKISREHDCGIKEDVVYAHVDKEKARRLNLV